MYHLQLNTLIQIETTLIFMYHPKPTLQYVVLLCCCFFYALSTQAQLVITVDQYMGANVRERDPVDKMGAVGFIREYHNWYFNEGYPDGSSLSNPNYSLGYPNAKYKWSTGYQDTSPTFFEDFYVEMLDNELEFAPCFLGALRQIVDPDGTSPYDAHILDEFKPVAPDADTLDPASYIAHAAYMYQYAARYGKTVLSQKKIDSIITPNLFSGEVAKTGLGYVNYMEDFNEQDKFWYRMYNGAYQTYFSPEAYATMLSADYDGHMSTLGRIANPDNPTDTNDSISVIGIKNADPNMKVVIGGLADSKVDYFRGIVDWSVNNRTGPNILPFDVLNIHKYTSNDPDNFLQGTFGVSPEEGGMKEFLEEFAAYRDSLENVFGGGDPNFKIELWLSEFGYDTYTPGLDGFGNPNKSNAAPQIGDNDTYEVQGQWITRVYLEALAAGVDRAMMFDIRDVCTDPSPFCGLYSASGLLENVENDHKPKNSWFYTYTMKNVLTDMVFDTIMSTCVDTTCARVYKFKDPNDVNKRVYAIWSPTSSDDTLNFEFNLEDIEEQTVVKMELPSIWGVSSVIDDENPILQVTERPLFIIVNGNHYVPQTCAATPVISNPTCASLDLKYNIPSNGGDYQVWYMEGVFETNQFSHRLAKLATDQAQTGDSIRITGLNPETFYTFFFIPEGVAISQSDKMCKVIGQTLAATSSCYIPLEASWIFDGSLADDGTLGINFDGLVDEQAGFDPLCAPTNMYPTSIWGNNYGTDIQYMSIDLQQYYTINSFIVLDANGIGDVTFQTADSPNGPWTTFHTLRTTNYNTWTVIADALPNDGPIRYLRMEKGANDAGNLGELYICGTPSVFQPDILPGVGTNGILTALTCETADIQWNEPFDNDIKEYKIIYGDNVITPNYTAGTQSYQLTGLMQDTTYNIAIVTIDNALQESTDSLKITFTTYTTEECYIVCNVSCACAICIRPNWISNLLESAGHDWGAENLVNDQDLVPFCGTTGGGIAGNRAWGWNYVPTNGSNAFIEIDLQAVYDISAFHFFAQGGAGGPFEAYYKDGDTYVKFVDFNTAAYGWVNGYDNLNFQTQYLRLNLGNRDARIGEIGVCGTLMMDNCPTTLDLPTTFVQSDTFNAGTITSTATVNTALNIGYFAETSITLTDGFEVKSGAEFLAKIEACSTPLVDNIASPALKIQSPKSPTTTLNNLSIAPNPFQSNTTLAYQLHSDATVSIDILDATGKSLTTIMNNQRMPKGSYRIPYERANLKGGFYMTRLRVGKDIIIKKMILID